MVTGVHRSLGFHSLTGMHRSLAKLHFYVRQSNLSYKDAAESRRCDSSFVTCGIGSVIGDKFWA